MNAASSLQGKIGIIQGAYHIEYLMEDVRVTYKHDVKLSVDGVTIDAKEEIQDSDISAYLSRALNRERIAKPHDLSGLDPDFYIRINDYLEGLRERERENIIVSLNSFLASRLEKIVKLAAASPLSPELERKLSVEEKELYILVHNSASEFKERALKKFD